METRLNALKKQINEAHLRSKIAENHYLGTLRERSQMKSSNFGLVFDPSVIFSRIILAK